MESIRFDDGYKSFAINGDENRVIRFNPSDIDIIRRYQESIKGIEASKEKIENIELNADGSAKSDVEVVADSLTVFNEELKKELNHIFNSDVYDIVFCNQSPLCIVGNGKNKKYLFEAFLDSITPIIKNASLEAGKESQKRMSKYTEHFHK